MGGLRAAPRSLINAPSSACIRVDARDWSGAQPARRFWKLNTGRSAPVATCAVGLKSRMGTGAKRLNTDET